MYVTCSSVCWRARNLLLMRLQTLAHHSQPGLLTAALEQHFLPVAACAHDLSTSFQLPTAC